MVCGPGRLDPARLGDSPLSGSLPQVSPISDDEHVYGMWTWEVGSSKAGRFSTLWYTSSGVTYC